MTLMQGFQRLCVQAGTPAGPGHSPFVESVLKFLSGFDWNWLLFFATGAMLVFAGLLLGAMFIKRWQMARLGFFLFTAATFIVRLTRPDDKFWNIAALVGAFASVFLLFSIHVKSHMVNRKEPIYYLLNTATLVLIYFPINFFTAIMAAVALIGSVFFLTTKAPSHGGKYKTREADPIILESLEKRSRKRL